MTPQILELCLESIEFAHSVLEHIASRSFLYSSSIPYGFLALNRVLLMLRHVRHLQHIEPIVIDVAKCLIFDYAACLCSRKFFHDVFENGRAFV